MVAFCPFGRTEFRDQAGWFILTVSRVGTSCPTWQGTGVKMRQGRWPYCSGYLWRRKPGLVAHSPGQSHLGTPRLHSQVRGKTKKDTGGQLSRRCGCPDFNALGHFDIHALLSSFIQTEEPPLDWRGATKVGTRYEDKDSPGFILKVLD